jgi:1,4-dihydroxy-2-naphthoate octaprenyltransferase
MSTLKAWIQASRLPSQSYILFPLLLGQAIYYAQTGRFSLIVFLLLHLYGLFLQLFIVYANDRADIETDRMNTTYTIFSGGSRTLVDGLITLRENTLAITAVIACNAAVGFILTGLFRRELALPLIAISLMLLWLYSFSPVRLSYRGGGELLQMLGVGLVLPLFGFYGQAGSLAAFPFHLLAFILPCQLSCAIATSLPDEPSDRNSNKHTASVLLGLAKAKTAVIALFALSLILFLILSPAPIRHTATVLTLPMLCFAGVCILYTGSFPGSRRLNLFVTCAVGVNVLLMAGSALMFFCLP